MNDYEQSALLCSQHTVVFFFTLLQCFFFFTFLLCFFFVFVFLRRMPSHW